MRLHLLYGAGHTGAGQVQRIAQVGDSGPHALCFQYLDDIQILNVRGRHTIGQGRQQVPGTLCQIAGIHQLLDKFDRHKKSFLKVAYDNYLW